MTKISSLDDGYQTGDLSVFPEAVDDQETLYAAVNNGETVLIQGLPYGGKRIIVNDASKFPSQGLLRVGSPSGNFELIYYEKRSNTTFLNLIRGFAGTIQNTWPATSSVTASVMAEHHNAAKDGIINVQQYLGIKDNPAEGSLNYKLIEQETRFLTPKAAFFAYPPKGSPSLKVRFQNFSNGDIIRSFWDFGDGSFSTEVSPSHTYATEGLYTVKLNVITSTGGQGSATKYNYINVSNDFKPTFFYIVAENEISTTLTANLDINSDVILVDDTSAFPSQGVIYINDEQIDYKKKTTTSFKIITRGYGSTNASSHIIGDKVTKAYYSTQTALARSNSGIEPGAIATVFNLVDQSDGNIASRYWVFGDGTSIEESDPDVHSTSHYYQLPGSYVTTLLLVFSDQNTKRVFLPNLITVI